MNNSQLNIKLVSFLAASCGILVLMLIGEWFYAHYDQQQLLNQTLPADNQSAQETMPSIDLTQQAEESYENLVTRPLFLEGRKPVVEPTPEQTQANAVAVKFDWLLTGVYTTKQGLSALFSRAQPKMPKDNHRKIKQGEFLDGWRLLAIHKDKVVLSQESGQKELMLHKPKLKQLPQKKNTPPPQPAEAEPEATAETPTEEVIPPETVSPEESIENNDNEQF